MAKHGKKYKAALAKVDLDKEYSVHDAVALAKDTSITKFDSTVEVHIRTALDPRQSDQQVRDVVVLPNGLGKTVRVLVFAQGEGAASARASGADLVADDDETLKKIGNESIPDHLVSRDCPREPAQIRQMRCDTFSKIHRPLRCRGFAENGNAEPPPRFRLTKLKPSKHLNLLQTSGSAWWIAQRYFRPTYTWLQRILCSRRFMRYRMKWRRRQNILKKKKNISKRNG